MKSHINLLPLSFRRRQMVRRILTLWACVLTAVLALISVGYLARLDTYRAQLARLHEQSARYQPIHEMQNDIVTLTQEIAELEASQRLSLKLAQREPPLALVDIVSKAAESSEGRVCVQKLVLVESAGPDASGDRLLTLSGIGMDNLSVARFVASLRDAEVFERVELKSAGGKPSGEAELSDARTYVLECAY